MDPFSIPRSPTCSSLPFIIFVSPSLYIPFGVCLSPSSFIPTYSLGTRYNNFPPMYNRYSHPLSHPHFDEAGTVSSFSLIGTLRAKGEQFQIMKTQVGRELHIEVNLRSLYLFNSFFLCFEFEKDD